MKSHEVSKESQSAFDSSTLSVVVHMQKQAAGIVGNFMEDIFGKELKPWQENEKTEMAPSA